MPEFVFVEAPLPPVIDLDAYRRKRESEGTWPIPTDEYRRYWQERLEELRKRNGESEK